MGNLSLVDLLRERAEELPDSRAYTFLNGGWETECLTFSDLDERSRAVGARLQQLGARGERALLLFPTGMEYISAFYGCLAAGTVAVTAYPPRQNRNLERIEAIIEDAQPKVALTTEGVYKQLKGRFDESPLLARLQWVIVSDVAVEEAAGWVDPNATGDTLAFLQYTSASTSKPKGVMVSHGNILHNQILMKEAASHDRNVIMVSWLPLFHDMGLISMVLGSLYNGVPLYLMPPVDFLKKPRLWLEAMTRYRATFTGAPDFGYQLCVDRIPPSEQQGLDLSELRFAFNGSEPVREQTLLAFERNFAGVGLRKGAMFPCYGLAEHTLYATGRYHKAVSFSRISVEQLRPRESEEGQVARLVSCGPGLFDTRVVIADPETHRRLGDGHIGEIWLASPSVAHGYWNQPELTEQTFRAHLDDGDGPFMRTGDLGFLHGGELFVTGRLKDLIILRGRNLVPQDIEIAVEGCDPAIRPAYVAAVSVESGGSERLVVVAEVRREGRQNIDTDALMARIRAAVANEFQVEVSAVVLIRPNTLAKTSSGKTQRATVRQQFVHDTLEVLAQWRDDGVFESGEGRAESGEETRGERRAVSGEDGVQPIVSVADAAPMPAALHAPPIPLPSPVSALRSETEPPVNTRAAERFGNWLAERVSVHAKIPRERITREAKLASFALDSVVVVTLVSEIETTFGVALELDGLFDGDPTLCELAQRIYAETQKRKAETPPRFVMPAPVAGPKRLVLRAVPDVPKSGEGRAESGDESPAPLKTRTNGNGNGNGHPYRTCVNPELGRALAQMGMDKSFVRGEGCWLYDEQGHRYLDFLAQYGALPFGFNPPRIWAAIRAIEERAEPSFVQPSYLNAAGELAKRLLAVAPPGMAYVTYANSGAEAIEAAIKLCRSTTGRHGVLAATNGFHGKTLGALSATDKEKYQKGFGAPVPGFDYVPFGDLDALRRALASGRYAAFLVEPIQGEGGIVEAPAGYLRLARKACRETGTLFVADEVQTGLGRTGAMFVCRELGITPDVMTVAKALGGGLVPIGACLATAAAYNDDFALKHTSTFAGNTLAARAGLATLDLLEENGGALIARVAENGARLKEGLEELARRYPGVIGEVRGRGYLLGLRFGLDRHNVEDGLLGYLGEQEALTALVVSHLLHVEHVRVGYTLNQGGVLRIEPPLTATWAECQYFLGAIERVVQRIAHRNLAVLTSQVTGYQWSDGLQPAEERSVIPRPRRLAPQKTDGRFAFLVHPLAWKDFGDIDRSLAGLSDEQVSKLSNALGDNFDSLVVGETRVVGDNGKTAYGEFVLVPRRADELKAMPPQRALAEVLDAAKIAQKRGAKIIGLGAYTSVVTQGGLALKPFGLPPLTTGNSYTVIAARQTIRLAAAARGWALPRRTIGVIGAGGAIGQALSVLLARDAGRLVLLGNPAHVRETRERLLQVAGRIAWSLSNLRGGPEIRMGSVASWVEELDFESPAKPDRASLTRLGEELIRRTHAVEVSTDAAGLLRDVDLIVCCTSSTERLVREEYLREGAVVCDVSRPTNVDVHVRANRPDVLVLDGGIVRMPGDANLGFNASLAKGHAYACMAETMMLAMEQRYQDAGLGYDLSIEAVLEMERIADELGFRVTLEHTERAAKQRFPEVVEIGAASA